MQKFAARFLLCFHLTTLVFPIGTAVAEETGNVVACEGTTGDGAKVCVQAPEGIISGSDKAKEFVKTLNWLLMAASIIACVAFLLKASARLSDEQYKEAIGPGVGAGIAALSMYIAYQLIS